MLPTVAPRAQMPQGYRSDTAFRAAFIAHLGVSRIRAAMSKTAPGRNVRASELYEFEFFTPPSCLCAALVVDVDRPEAVIEIFDALPAEIYPSWVVETPKGAQAGWMIDPVDLRPTAREHPIRFARATGSALRRAVAGDASVDPVSPARVRNPSYRWAETRAAATPLVYRLGTLHQGLKAAGLWNPETPTFQSTAETLTTSAVIEEGGRNVAVFDACRYAAYRGEDHEAAAWSANDRCSTALPTAEVLSIIRSVTRFVQRSRRNHNGTAITTMSAAMREALSEMGRRGGLANTVAQRAARATGPRAATAVRKASADARAKEAQRMHVRGYSRAAICQRLGASAASLCRWLRRYVLHRPRVSLLEHQVFEHPLLSDHFAYEVHSDHSGCVYVPGAVVEPPYPAPP